MLNIGKGRQLHRELYHAIAPTSPGWLTVVELRGAESWRKSVSFSENDEGIKIYCHARFLGHFCSSIMKRIIFIVD